MKGRVLFPETYFVEHWRGGKVLLYFITTNALHIDIQYTSNVESSIIPILFSTSQKYGKYCEPDSEQEAVSQRVERCCIEAVSWSCAVNKARSQGVPQSLIRSAALSRAGHRYTLSLSEDIIRIIRCCCFWVIKL